MRKTLLLLGLSAALATLVAACAAAEPTPTATRAAPTATRPATSPTTAAAATATRPAASPTVAAAASPTRPAASPTTAAAAGDVAAGKTVFDANCNACHPGGDKGVGPAVKGASADSVKTIVRSGKGAMPAFAADKINDKQLTDLIAYVQSLK